jgi:hypothetical protein
VLLHPVDSFARKKFLFSNALVLLTTWWYCVTANCIVCLL